MKKETGIPGIPEMGIIVLDKPRGPSSHQVTAWVAKMLGLPAGHSGTLDPMVSGVLVIMIGAAVRLAPVFLKEDKEYISLMRLHGKVSEEAVERIAEEFTGKIYQRPPRRSAVRRALRIRKIHEIEILEINGPLVLFRTKCEAGSYIRSLCTHMGLALGVGGQMQELRRTRAGSFTEQMACTLHELKDACVAAEHGHPAPLRERILPVEKALGFLPRVVVRDTAVDALCHGAVLAGVGVVERDDYPKGVTVGVYTEKGELICLGEALVSSASYQPGTTGLVIAPRTVLMAPGTYQRAWTTHRRE